MADCGDVKEEVKSSEWSTCLGEPDSTGLQNLTLSSRRGSIVVSRPCSTSSQCEVSPWSKWSSCQWSKFLDPLQIRKRYPTKWIDQEGRYYI
jgi:hypothetical protein